MGVNDRWVVEYPNGGWAVEKEDRERVSEVLRTQEQAVQRARVIIRNLGGGELVVKGRDGRIRMKDTVAGGGTAPARSDGVTFNSVSASVAGAGGSPGQ